MTSRHNNQAVCVNQSRMCPWGGKALTPRDPHTGQVPAEMRTTTRLRDAVAAKSRKPGFDLRLRQATRPTGRGDQAGLRSLGW